MSDFKTNTKFKFVGDDGLTMECSLDMFLKYKNNSISKEELLSKSKPFKNKNK